MTKDAVLVLQQGRPHRYRDELNFAEFPIASVSDTIAEGQKTLEFTDEIFDPSTNKTVPRTLVITAADKFGLPTAIDDEVLLGLMQVSCDQNFADRKVHFSRYELIKLLGWRDESKSYKRIEESLNRWTGVTLQYKKAWWSKEEQCWVSETFHVIDQVTVFDRERLERRRKMAKGGSPEKALSSFVWNETVFQSFKAGYIKSLDFDFYKSLTSAISKRMFRFLDKRFYHKPRWEFELRAFACEHVGLSKNYSNSELKRKLLPAVRELEERGVLAPMAEADRFIRVVQGEWKAVFIKATKKVAVLASSDDTLDALTSELVKRGITKRSAQKLVSQHAEAYVREKIQLFDSLCARKGASAIRNRAGWLYSAISQGYVGSKELPKPPLAPTPSARPAQAVAGPPADFETPRSDGSEAFDAYWRSLTNAEQESFEAAAVKAAPQFLQRQYKGQLETRGTLWRATRQTILLGHFKRAAGE